jgi:hypothetical protein
MRPSPRCADYNRPVSISEIGPVVNATTLYIYLFFTKYVQRAREGYPSTELVSPVLLSIRRGIVGQFRIMQRSALSSLYENSCCRCKQTISPVEQWYLRCQFKAFVDQ